jgi:protein-disulfide isomerase
MPLTLRRLLTPFLAVGLLAAIGVGPLAAQEKPASSTITPAQKRAIEEIVREFILQNPEVIVEAVKDLQEREKKETRKRAQDNLVAVKNDLLQDAMTPVGGNAAGDVTIVEFFDYRCGFCKRVMPSLVELLKADKNLRIVFKEFPILGPESVFASKAALAAWLIDKGKYESMHWALMKTTGPLPESRVLKIAADAGFDAQALKKKMEDPVIEGLIQKNYALAEALDINGTPAFVIGDQIIRGAMDADTIRKLVAQARGS